MKMKEVCELTGLTDRAVRLYIDQKLIEPEVTESYWGRRVLNFRPEDVQQLADIAVLRKYNFSITQIRAILEDPEAGQFLLENAILERQEQVLHQQKILSILCNAETSGIKNLSTLASSLRDAADNRAVPKDGETRTGYLRLFVRTVLICLALSAAVAALVLLTDMVVFYISHDALNFSITGLRTLFARSGKIAVLLLVGLCLVIRLGYYIMILVKYGRNSRKQEVCVSAIVIDKKQNADAVVLSSFYTRNSGMIEMLVFKTGDGSVLTLTVPRHIYHHTAIGTRGTLTYQGSKMILFIPDSTAHQ